MYSAVRRITRLRCGDTFPKATAESYSNCAPTSGQHETITGPNGEFEFEVYVHDTDMFRIEIEQDGYEAVRQSVGGFDCLFCTCPLFEIVLQPLGATTPAP
jgi:hypothetical protein